jgi:flagellar basal-body rod protein FlgF
MESTAYIALSRQMVLARQMEVIAHNVANMTATGFKAEALLLEPVPVAAGSGQRLAYVQDLGMVRDLGPGPITTTDNPLDLSIEGPGYFTIETTDGVRYGRSHVCQAFRGLLVPDGGEASRRGCCRPLGPRSVSGIA